MAAVSVLCVLFYFYYWNQGFQFLQASFFQIEFRLNCVCLFTQRLLTLSAVIHSVACCYMYPPRVMMYACAVEHVFLRQAHHGHNFSRIFNIYSHCDASSFWQCQASDTYIYIYYIGHGHVAFHPSPGSCCVHLPLSNIISVDRMEIDGWTVDIFNNRFFHIILVLLSYSFSFRASQDDKVDVKKEVVMVERDAAGYHHSACNTNKHDRASSRWFIRSLAGCCCCCWWQMQSSWKFHRDPHTQPTSKSIDDVDSSLRFDYIECSQI